MVGLDREQIAHDTAFLRTELAAVLRIQLRLPQAGRHVAQIPDRILNSLLPFGRHLPKRPRGRAHLLLLLRRKVFHVFYPFEHALALLGGHLVQLPQPVGRILLLLGR